MAPELAPISSSLPQTVLMRGSSIQRFPGSFRARQAAHILADRSASLASMLTNAGLNVEIGPGDAAGLPIAVIRAIGTPAIGGAALAYGIGNGIIGLGFAGYDYYLASQDYTKEVSVLKQALDKLIDRSLDLQLADFNRVKTEIDKKCN
jgi:hypothetical protein